MFLSCMVLCISCLSPFFTPPKTGYPSKAAIYTKAEKSVNNSKGLVDIEDEADPIADDDSDLVDNVQILPIVLVPTVFSNTGFPFLKDHILPKHFGELMVPPPQMAA